MNERNPYEPGKSMGEIPPLPLAPATPPDAIESLIPYRNKQALISYYSGLFSLCPVLGFPLAIAAIILGILGLKKRRRQPAVKGAVHAWIGIIAGSFGLLINLVIGLAIVGVFFVRR